MTDATQQTPPEYPISAEEAERRRIAYEARRRAYTEAWLAADQPKTEAAPA